MKRIAPLLALLVATSAAAVTIAPGDIADAPPPVCWGSGGCIATPPPPYTVLLGNDTQTKSLIQSVFIVAFGPNGHLYASAFSTVTEYDTALAIVRTFTTPVMTSLTVAQNGDVYVLGFTGVLTIYTPAGTPKQTLPLPFTTGPLIIPASLDLAADQCALLYTDGAQTGRRFDVCTQQALSDLAPGPWTAVRAMSDGGYVAARGATLSVFDAHNQLLRSFSPWPPYTVTALAFDADPHFLWTGTSFTLAKIDLATGATVVSAGPGPLYLAVNGEQRPAAAAFAPTVPALSPPLLLVLALGLTVLACQRLRG